MNPSHDLRMLITSLWNDGEPDGSGVADTINAMIVKTEDYVHFKKNIPKFHSMYGRVANKIDLNFTPMVLCDVLRSGASSIHDTVYNSYTNTRIIVDGSSSDDDE